MFVVVIPSVQPKGQERLKRVFVASEFDAVKEALLSTGVYGYLDSDGRECFSIFSQIIDGPHLNGNGSYSATLKLNDQYEIGVRVARPIVEHPVTVIDEEIRV